MLFASGMDPVVDLREIRDGLREKGVVGERISAAQRVAQQWMSNTLLLSTVIYTTKTQQQ